MAFVFDGAGFGFTTAPALKGCGSVPVGETLKQTTARNNRKSARSRTDLPKFARLETPRRKAV
jgi:hypothetical protein